jgi:hypothetical protein
VAPIDEEDGFGASLFIIHIGLLKQKLMMKK